MSYPPKNFLSKNQIMTNIVAAENPDLPSTQIDLAVKNLGADRTDLEQLFTAIQRKNVSRQQIPNLLKQAYGRLQILRSNLDEFRQLTASDTESASLVEQVTSTIQPGNMFSLAKTAHSLNALPKQYEEKVCASETVAMIHGMQALIAAIGQDYHKTEEHYAKAATTPMLSAALQWQYQIDRALTLEDLGREFGDNQALQQAISLLQGEILELAPVDERPSEWTITQHNLGNVCGILGQRQSGSRNLENSISAFKASLTIRDRKREPLQWAETQNNLGNSFGILAHRQNDESMLGNAIEAFEYALEERTRDVAPNEWATTQNNLAAVLQTLGQRNKDAKMLKRSTEAYKLVLQEWTKERGPLAWATAMNNLGTALRLLGGYRKGPRTLEQSVAAYKSALSERSRERLPQEWAMTQNNLGAALQKLAEHEENSETLAKAVIAYENALKEWTRERAPMAWTMTMANLGVARRTLAEVTDDLESAHKAVKELELVCDAFREASHAQYSEFSIEELAKARKLANTIELNTGKYAALVKH